MSRAPQMTQDELVRCYRNLFGSAEGRIVLADILSRICGLDRPVFRPDNLALAYNAARHDVGIEIETLARGDSKMKPEVKR